MQLNNHIGNVDIRLDTSRIDGNLKEAQKLLNMQVVADSEPFVPFQQGGLREKVDYPKGIYGGEIEYSSIYAHYQYMGIVYGPNYPIRDSDGNVIGWRSPPVKHPTDRPLTYKTPGTGSHWFEKAKAQHKGEWVKLVKQTAGKE